MRNESELDAWVLSTAPHAVAYATSLLRSREDAEDVVHDCYCRLIEKAEVYDLPRDGRAILFRSITNACVNVRSRRRLHARLGSSSHWDLAAGGCEPIDRRAVEPSRAAMAAELNEAVAAALGRLPQQQRAALELKSMGWSLAEIARSLDITQGHAAVLVHRARSAVSDRLASHLEERH